jgi:hypothetical protein
MNFPGEIAQRADRAPATFGELQVASANNHRIRVDDSSLIDARVIKRVRARSDALSTGDCSPHARRRFTDQICRSPKPAGVIEQRCTDFGFRHSACKERSIYGCSRLDWSRLRPCGTKQRVPSDMAPVAMQHSARCFRELFPERRNRSAARERTGTLDVFASSVADFAVLRKASSEDLSKVS